MHAGIFRGFPRCGPADRGVQLRVVDRQCSGLKSILLLTTPFSLSLEVITTTAFSPFKSRQSFFAVSKPMPLLPPVTMKTRCAIVQNVNLLRKKRGRGEKRQIKERKME